MKKTAGIILMGISIVLISCSTAREKVSFKSNWESTNDRIWAGPDYWANPLQDWRIRDGKLECIHQGTGRNVQLLTYQVGPESTFSMEVTVSPPAEGFKGWAGFRIASRGNLDEYRHNTINSLTGHDAILRSTGMLVLREDSVKIAWADKVALVLECWPDEGIHQARFTAKDTKGRVLGQVQSAYESSGISGNLALICHSDRNVPESYGEPVVSFEQFKLKGEGLRGGESQRWGPVLWSQYTVDRGILKLSAQFPPIGKKDSRKAYLEIHRGTAWEQIAEAAIDDMARVALFRIENWDESVEVPYRVAYHLDGKDHYDSGLIRRNPLEKEELSVAAFTGNQDF